MAKILIVIPVLLLFQFSIAAASGASSSASAGYALQEGSRALQFQIGSNFQLSDFQGNVISYKRHRSDNSSWRIGLSLEGRLSSDDSDTEQTSPPGENVTGQEREQSNRELDVTIRPQLQRYLETDKTVRPYVSYGVLTGYSYSFREREFYSVDETTTVSLDDTDEDTRHTLRIGATANFGVEWFAASSISFLAEYGADLYYHYSKSETMRESFNPDGEITLERETSASGQGVFLDPRSVRFGLSAYF